MLGTFALSSGYYDAYYGRAQRVRTMIARDFAAAFERFDVIATPTAPGVAFPLGAKLDDPMAMYLNDYFTVTAPLAGIPAISIPCGLAAPVGGGPQLPVGFQLAGPPFGENRLLRGGVRARAGARLRALVAGGGAVTPRAGHRARDPRPARDHDEDVLRLRAELRRPAEHAHLLGLPRPAGIAAGRQRPRDPLRPADRAGARLRAGGALGLPPQELLLSGPAEGLPDLPVRRAAVPRRRAGRRAHPPRAPRGGRGEADPRRRERAHPRLRALGRRLQPRRHAARRDRHRARPALGGAGARVARAAARDAARARRERREHGGGLAARRRERLAAPGGLRRARHEDRAEEHELVPLPRARDHGRDRAPARDHRGRRSGRAGDAALRSRERRDHLAALQGGGARLPLLPRARPRRRSRRRRR